MIPFAAPDVYGPAAAPDGAGLAGLDEAVADTVHRLDRIAPKPGGEETVPQTANRVVQEIVRVAVAGAPDALDNPRVGQDASAVLDEKAQQLPLRPRQAHAAGWP